jgi:hypothetical protein
MEWSHSWDRTLLLEKDELKITISLLKLEKALL